MKLSERLIKYAQDYATKEGHYLEVTKELTNELITELKAEKKAIAEKAFIAGGDLSDEEWWLGEYATTENLKEHERLKYKDFNEWYKQEIEGEEK